MNILIKFILTVLIFTLIPNFAYSVYANHFPNRAERVTEQMAKFGPESDSDFPGLLVDPSCVGVTDNTFFWFNHTVHEYKKCLGGVAIVIEYVLTVDKNLLTVSKDIWGKRHSSFGNIGQVDIDPIDLTHQSSVLLVSENLTSVAGITEAHGIFNNFNINFVEDQPGMTIIGLESRLSTDPTHDKELFLLLNNNNSINFNGSGSITFVEGSSSNAVYGGSSTIGRMTHLGMTVNPKATGSEHVLETRFIEMRFTEEAGHNVVFDVVEGLYIRDMSIHAAVSSHNIFSRGLNSLNTFEGKVDIGNTLHTVGAVDLDSTLNVDGKITLNNRFVLNDIETGITAEASGTQASAYQLTKTINLVSIVVGNLDGVKLPVVTGQGQVCIIFNEDTAQEIAVFPQTGGKINNLAINAAQSIPDSSASMFISTSSLNWVVMRGIQ